MNSNIYVIKNNKIYKPGEVKVLFRNFNFSPRSKWYDVCNIYVKETVNGVEKWTPSYEYTWDMNQEWGTTCSEDCGGGKIYRKPGTCTRKNLTTQETDVVDEFICAFIYRRDPEYDYSQPCNTNIPCSSDKYKWVADEWGECLGGYRGRSVGCFVSYLGSNGDVYHIVDDSFCQHLGSKPIEIEECS